MFFAKLRAFRLCFRVLLITSGCFRFFPIRKHPGLLFFAHISSPYFLHTVQLMFNELVVVIHKFLLTSCSLQKKDQDTVFAYLLAFRDASGCC